MPAKRTFWERMASLLRADPVGPRGPASGDSLALERRTYEAHKAALLASHEGEWVVIHRDRILGVRADYEEALRLGYDRAGYVDLMIHRIAAHEPVLILPPELA
jgi:hypothetical protein